MAFESWRNDRVINRTRSVEEALAKTGSEQLFTLFGLTTSPPLLYDFTTPTISRPESGEK
jgi:hypothetical protein